jgi:RNA polymerase sigma factor (sigma-70 family)
MSTEVAPSTAVNPPAVDVARLYPLLNRRLRQIVELDLDAPPGIAEDACQLAWCQLLRHAHRVEPVTVLPWLASTAKREAVRQLRREQRDASLDAVLDAGGEALLPRAMPGVAELASQRQRLAALGGLPVRQQRALWLHAAGHTYQEIAAVTGDTPRTVQRQLLRGRRRARALAA